MDLSKHYGKQWNYQIQDKAQKQESNNILTKSADQQITDDNKEDNSGENLEKIEFATADIKDPFEHTEKAAALAEQTTEAQADHEPEKIGDDLQKQDALPTIEDQEPVDDQTQASKDK